ncbi:peptidoglycan-binding protein [Neolewinella aurantiaca]|uniref:Peptidoglycan-binding protein n=1 Tax=Neolewinella aurantiaca TaxID=2602767 RepID=A0A5C7FBN0_9BACT|nr:peptidoglycan-binding domain-containing protein [Neolewinella aurantiaca]TXF88286.1 peptidoglycan-binding protein [Neolewinella aurantiaca]
MQRLLLLLLMFGFTGSLIAQNLYTIKVGTFRDVKADDFTSLRGQGFVYGAAGADNTVDVYVGQYSDVAKANATAASLNNNGFRNAQALALPLSTGQQVTVIQIALHSGDRSIDWPTLERAGQLFVESVDGVNKIVTGIYPDARTAASFLPAIRELGYSDAFVKTINNVRLIPINQFETGIKKPLIPIDLTAKAPVPETPEPTASPATYGSKATPAPVAYSPAPAPATPAATPTTTATPAATTGLPSPASSPTLNLPAIDGKTKRHSSAELQRVLKEKGYYAGSIDGYYGPGTTAAYEAAWDDMPEIRKYRKLSEMALAPAGNTERISKWPEVSTLLAVVEDLSAGMANDARARQLVQQRSELTNATQALTPVAVSRINNWVTTIWTNLEEWATEDPLHAQIFSAFRLTYQQSQVRLEDYYMDKGLSATDARDLSSAMLQNLVGAQLDRFL